MCMGAFDLMFTFVNCKDRTCMQMYICAIVYVVCVCCIKAYYLISPTNRGMSSAWLGSIAASSSAAVKICASGSATHQSESCRGPTADCATHSTMLKTNKTVMSLYLVGHNCRIGLAVL